jgi:hypothetical protein
MAGSDRTALVSVFEDRAQAARALEDLERAGFKADDFGLVIRGAEDVRGGMITDAAGTKDAKGAATGAAAGAGVGAVLGAAASLLLPGIGPVVALGIFTMAAGGAVAGTAVGGILGAMAGLGISEEEARFYENEFKSGRAIVAVKAGGRVSEAAKILRARGGYDLETRPHSPVQTSGAFSEP